MHDLRQRHCPISTDALQKRVAIAWLTHFLHGADQCPLCGAERTLSECIATSQFDPFETLALIDRQGDARPSPWRLPRINVMALSTTILVGHAVVRYCTHSECAS